MKKKKYSKFQIKIFSLRTTPLLAQSDGNAGNWDKDHQHAGTESKSFSGINWDQFDDEEDK